MITASGSLLRKIARDGIGYSVVELTDVRQFHIVAVPQSGCTLEQQARDALRMIETVLEKEGARSSVVRQTVFVADAAFVKPCKQLMREFYGEDMPTTTYVRQRPCDGKMLAIEVMGVGADAQIERISEQLVVASHNGLSWAHVGGVMPRNALASVFDGSKSAFTTMCALLDEAGIRFDQIVRTWLYLGDIVGMEGPVQRNNELNRARTDFFTGTRFLADRLPRMISGVPSAEIHAYPASTGIGADGFDVTMGCVALATERKDILAVPLENPRQTAAYDYAAAYSPKSPKFARAMALSCGSHATIFVSGTASITDSETRHIGDAVKQTHETIDNIVALIGEANLARHGLPGLGAVIGNMGMVRVYVKNQEDYAAIRAACEERLGDVPAVYTIADVCRPDLLVEIEGVAFSRMTAKS